MTQIDDTPLRKTAQRFALGFQIATGVTALLILGLVGAVVVHTDATGAWLAQLAGSEIAPRPWQSMALTAVTCIGLALYYATFSAAGAVSRVLAKGALTDASGPARRLSHWVWGVLVWSVAAHTLSVLIATAHAAPGQRVVSIAIGSPQMSIALAALVAAFLAQVLTLVAALWEDHKEIV